MSPLSFVLVLFIASVCSFLCTLFLANKQRKLPPGPPALPLIGNLHMLGTLPHRTLHSLAKKYGHIMFMRLGHVPTIVVSSPQAAELFLKTHDSAFASRPKSQASKYIFYGSKAMALTAYGPYWRDVKKLCITELLNSSKIENFAPLRREELELLVGDIKKAAIEQNSVDITAMVSGVIENITYRMLFGQQKIDQVDIASLVKEALHLVGAFNIADYNVPIFGAFDLQGLTKRMKALSCAMDKVLEKIIDDRQGDNGRGKNQQNDLVDVLLSIMNHGMDSSDDEVAFDRSNVKAIIVDMIIGAIDTSATAIDWTFSELLRHTNVMKCVKEELQDVVGMDRIVDEIDLPNLSYLDMVIKESYRLHPVTPLLLPRESMEDITINGYFIPTNSRIIVNTWAIGRDPNVWSYNVEELIPERFQGTNKGFRDPDFQLIPFGSGRRGCPGMQLGLTVVKLVLAQLVHCFNWELPNGIPPVELDMKETFGLTTQRASNLLAVPTYRLSI